MNRDEGRVMDKSKSKYFNTARKMDKAFLEILEKKDIEYITVKEICQQANVNRSTFYLHYENIGDLLEECIEYVNEQFLAYFKGKCIDLHQQTQEELILINSQYLFPYLTYIKENKRIFKTFLSKPITLNTVNTLEEMFKHVIEPIMEKFQIPQKERKYRLVYYIHGLMAVIEQWLKTDCCDSIEQISCIMIKCVLGNENLIDDKGIK